MDQNKNSGDGEPKSASARDQCKLKYTQKGGEVTASELSAESLSASPKSPMEAGNKVRIPHYVPLNRIDEKCENFLGAFSVEIFHPSLLFFHTPFRRRLRSKEKR